MPLVEDGKVTATMGFWCSVRLFLPRLCVYLSQLFPVEPIWTINEVLKDTFSKSKDKCLDKEGDWKFRLCQNEK